MSKVKEVHGPSVPPIFGKREKQNGGVDREIETFSNMGLQQFKRSDGVVGYHVSLTH